ncbi:conserved hypothetical protein [Gammaproteobacteria bacterium]
MIGEEQTTLCQIPARHGRWKAVMSDLVISSGSYTYQTNSQNATTASQSLYGSGVSVPNHSGYISTTIGQTLAQISNSLGSSGSSGSSASDTASSTQAPESLGSFLHNMFAALQLESEATTQKNAKKNTAGETESTGSKTSSASNTIVSKYYGSVGTSTTANKLLDLSQQVLSSGSSNTALDALQRHFQGLAGFQSQSGIQSTLGNFLQALSKNLQVASPVGNFIQTKA